MNIYKAVEKVLDRVFDIIPYLVYDSVVTILIWHSHGAESFEGLVRELEFVIAGEYSPLEVELGDALLLYPH